MLEGNKVTKYFGGLPALRDVDFLVREKEIAGLIGPNGAGKTTLFNLVSGIYRPTSGVLKFNGEDIARLKPHEICQLGIGRTFQIVIPFMEMTALENAMVGLLYGKGRTTGMREARSEALRYLDFVGLSERKNVSAKSLTIADRKMLEMARALSTNPKIILLDEVVAGLNPTETLQAMNLVRRIRDELGITVFWVEHVMKAVMGVAERVMVLHHGEKIAEGSPKEIAENRTVIDAYLGEKYII